MDQGVLDARAKLRERFGNTQIGGKGKHELHSFAILNLLSKLWFSGKIWPS